MWSRLLDSFKASFAQEVEFGEEKGQLATHSLPSTREVALSQRLAPGGRCPGMYPLPYISPWLCTALGVKTGSLAWHSRPPQCTLSPSGPPPPPSGTIIPGLAEPPLAPRAHQLSPSLSLCTSCFLC